MDSAPRLRLAEPATAAERITLESFIAARFRAVYGANVSHFCNHVVGMRGAQGGWHAAAGYTAAGSNRLFLEQYLDAPAEALLSRASGCQVERDWIAEVGNLAATPGLVRALIPALGAYLYQLGYRWVVFTATRELHNAFRRVQLEPLVLAPAEASRVPDRGAAWGSYYAHAPKVMGGLIAACLPGRMAA
jgi:hypothetical protein